jgi:HSP20 family protein
MAVSRWDPWAELAAMQRDVQELFGRTSGPRRATATLVPPMDAYRTEDATVLHLEVPGFAPDQIDISYHRGVLTISGERATASDVHDDAWIRRERTSGRFTRSVGVSPDIDPSKIAASFDNGVLEVRIPHAPAEQPTRIPVSGGETASSNATVDVTASSSTAGGNGSS